MSDKSDGEMIGALIIGAIAGLLIGAGFGGCAGDNIACDRIHRDAVKAGAARWATDEAGNAKFEWVRQETKP